MSSTQRLYRLGSSRYVQHDGISALPAEVEAYCLKSRGATPPYIPLPSGPATFRVGVEFSYGREVHWDGSSPLPEAVLAYVCEHGLLPPRSSVSESSFDFEEERNARGISDRKAS